MLSTAELRGCGAYTRLSDERWRARPFVGEIAERSIINSSSHDDDGWRHADDICLLCAEDVGGCIVLAVAYIDEAD